MAEQEYDAEEWDAALYGDEEEMVVDQEMADKEQLEATLETLKIEFRPQVLKEGAIAQFAGTMTDWVPVNMRPTPLEQVYRDPDSEGLFSLECKVVRDYLYRFSFFYDDERVLSKDYALSKDSEGQETNHIYVGDE